MRCGYDAFTIATSDGGLASLAIHLREAGRRVTVIADKKARESLRCAAHRFVELPPLAEPAAILPERVTPPSPRPPVGLQGLSSLDHFVRDIVEKAGLQGLPLTEVNVAVQKGLGTKIATLPEKNWRVWLMARPHLFALDPRGPDARVRLARIA